MAEMNCRCGLLTTSKDPVPLKSISVDIQIKGFVADVSATLTYKNEEKNPVEAIFVFPMDDDSAVYNFEAVVDGKKIVAEIQEKKQAQETYADAISQGQEAFLLEEDESSGDIFTCSVGNLPPGQESAVTLAFVRELPLEPDGAVRFVLPAVLNPRYTPREAGTVSVTAGIPRVPSGQLSYSLKVTASIMSAYGVSHVQANCGLTPLQYLKEDKTSAKVSLADEHKFDRDVELLIYYQEVNKPSVLVESPQLNAHPGSLMADAMLMLNFYPNVPESPEQSSSGEFVFLMDRSGSMACQMNNDSNSPSRINSAKETMLLLLKSLPLGCYFNVFSFGSNYDFFFPESVEYTQDSMKTALKKIEEMQANMGGTEILQPLKHIYSKVGKPGHPRQLFVFTDGEVNNTKSVIAEVQRNSHEHRCFAFGIGEGASTALIKGIARAANGTAEFITGKERMQPKALQTLKCSLQPVVKDVSLKWTLPTGVESVLLSHLPNAIFRGQRSILYAQLKGKIGGATDADVSLEYTYNDEIFKNTIKFSLQSEKETSQTIHRLAAKNVIKDLENGSDKEKEEVKKRILETSLESCVICSLTGFVAVNKDLKQPIQGPLIQRHIPLGGSRRAMMASPMMYSAMPVMQGGGRHRIAAMSAISMPMRGSMMVADCPAMAVFGAPKSSGLLLEIHTKASRKKSFAPRGEKVSKSCQSGLDVYESALIYAVEDKTDTVVRLVSLQNADGSWPLDAEFATALGLTQKELQKKAPGKDIDQSVWATVLALVWLHSKSADRRDEWELLEGKALKWVKTKAGSSLAGCVVAANSLLKASVDPKVFGL